MYRLRSSFFRAFFYLWATVSCLLWAPLLYIPSVPRKWHVAFQTYWLHSVLFWLKAIMGLQKEVRGTENIAKSPVIYAMKHQSMLDTFVMHTILNDPTFIMKKELLKVPLYGQVCEKVGNIPIDREMGMKSMKKMLTQSGKEIKKGRSVIIFPEGSRGKPGEKLPYLSGIFGIYKYLKVPVVPVAVNTGVYWPKGGVLKKGKFIIEFLPPINPGLSKDTFMEQVEDAIETASMALFKNSPV